LIIAAPGRRRKGIARWADGRSGQVCDDGVP